MMNISIGDKFVFRTPLLAFSNCNVTRSTILDICKRPLIKEAIYLASPVLYDELNRWEAGVLQNPAKIIKLQNSLYKYLSRMSTRCTPYGLFATCSIGSWDDHSEIRIPETLHRKTRLDMYYMGALFQHFEKINEIKSQLVYYPNNSLYPLGDDFRFIDFLYNNGNKNFSLGNVKSTEYLVKILIAAADGRTISELALSVIDEDIVRDEAEAFISELIDNRILISDFSPAITGKDILDQMLDSLKDISRISISPQLQQQINLLKNIQSHLNILDASEVNDVEKYRNIVAKVRDLKVPYTENKLFQVDTFRNCPKATISTSIKKELRSSLRFLLRLSTISINENIQRFKSSFRERYGDQEMPLLKVLDAESGIGYPNSDTHGIQPLIENLAPAGARRNFITIPFPGQSPRDIMLWAKLSSAIKNEEYSVRFTDDDIKDLQEPRVKVAATMAAMFNILDEGSKICLKFIGGGASAGNLLGRFAYGSREIREIVDEIAAHEAKINQQNIVAEIVHIPNDRAGNILFRPILRKYEIPFLTKSSVKKEQQILPEDLFISVIGDRVILKSKKLNKEILPRLTCAHNYSQEGLPVYTFLCDLQSQDVGIASLSFNWGSHSRLYKFLPRAEYKNTLVFLATWNFDKSDLDDLQKIISEWTLIIGIKKWCDLWKIPQYAVLKDNDNELLINFKEMLSVETFLHTIKKRNSIELKEYVLDPETSPIKNAQHESFGNEIIATIYNHDFNNGDIQLESIFNSTSEIKRVFVPGSEWLYMKIYCGVKVADKILIDTIKPLIKQLTNSKLAEKWFFVRYVDPDPHIRLRFYNTDPSKNFEIIKLLLPRFESLISQGIINKILNDTYVRELERYGHDTISEVESYFENGSEIALTLMHEETQRNSSALRWKFALKGIDVLLKKFGMDLNKRLEFVTELESRYSLEHGQIKTVKRRLDMKYRNYRKIIESAFDVEKEDGLFIDQLCNEKIANNENIAKLALTLSQNSVDTSKIKNELIVALIHMDINRMFSAGQRTYELVFYAFLRRIYKSQISRKKELVRKNLGQS